jgi:hypothetical protein
MSYGALAVDTIVYTSGGLDASTTISGIVNGAFPNLAITGTLSGATVTGNSGLFTSLTAVTGTFSSGLVLQSGNATLNAQSQLRFADSDSSNWTALRGAASITSNVTWTLPDADGVSGQVLFTNGTGTLGWNTPLSSYTITVTATGKTLVNRERCTITASGQTLTLPGSPSAGDEVTVTVAGTFIDTVVARNGSNIMSLAENMTLNQANISVTLYYVDAIRGWRLI